MNGRGTTLKRFLICAVFALCAGALSQPATAAPDPGSSLRDLVSSHRAHERVLAACVGDGSLDPVAAARMRDGLARAGRSRAAAARHARAGRLLAARIVFRRSRARLGIQIGRCRSRLKLPLDLPGQASRSAAAPAPPPVSLPVQPSIPAAAPLPGEAAGPLAQRLVAVAEGRLGTPYLWGASGPHLFDCSGFVWWVYRAAGIDYPRASTYTDWPSGIGPEFSRGTDPDELRVGDLLYLINDDRGPGHMGMYVGGGQMIHASSGAGRVIRSDITSGFYRERFVGRLRHRAVGG
jgi:cell wall-associated NlpC family hydrolase